MRHPDIVTTNCVCGKKDRDGVFIPTRISHHKDEPPRRCVACGRKFVNEDEVVIIKGKNPPTIVRPEPVVMKKGVN